MLDDLRRIIESEMEYDDLNDIMMEATDNAIADMFIEEDGEAVISDAEVMGILEKIPEYDEETAMNKKLARIAEAYIPEELVGIKDYIESYDDIQDSDYLEEGLGLRLKKTDKLKAKMEKIIANIKDIVNDPCFSEDDRGAMMVVMDLDKKVQAIKKELDRRQEKADKKAAKKATKNGEQVQQESTEVEDDLTYLYEMFDLDDLIK